MSRARSPRQVRRVSQRKPDQAGTTGAVRRESRVAPQAQTAAPGFHSVLSLQETLGNQQVARLLAGELSGAPGLVGALALTRQASHAAGPVQRFNINYASTSETIYNQTNATSSEFEPHVYGGGQATRYVMTRGPSGVNVNVRIKFVNQTRDTSETNPDGTRNRNFLHHLGSPTEIPASDARRAWATTMCGQLVNHWNKRFALVSHHRAAAASSGAAAPVGASGAPAIAGAAAAGAAAAAAAGGPSTTAAAAATGAAAPAPATTTSPGEIRLPITFVATPVFDLAATDFDRMVRLYGNSVSAGATGHPIDAGNYYTNIDPSSYSAPADAIYAHEYGHLIGINDEYSRSNLQMHLLMHHVSPTAATRMNAELDRETTKRMILAALRPQLRENVGNMGLEVAGAFGTMREGLEHQLAEAIRRGWSQGGVIADTVSQIRTQLDRPESQGVRAALGEAVRFEAQDNLSNITYAQEVLDVALSAGQIQTSLSDLYSSAIDAAVTAPIALRYTDVAGRAATISISAELAAPLSPNLPGTLGGTLNTAATTIASQSVGQGETAGPGGASIPAIASSSTLLGALMALPGQWRTRHALLGPYVDAGTTAMDISDGWTTYLASTDFSTAATVRDLYRMLYEGVHSVAIAVAQTQVRRFLEGEMNPLIQQQLASLGTLIDQEATRVGSAATPPPRAGGPDPLADSVAQMQVAMRDRLAAQTPSGAAAEPAAGTQTQAVRYDVQGLMGDNAAGTVVRSDFLEGLVGQFNLPANGLIDADTEENFRSETS